MFFRSITQWLYIYLGVLIGIPSWLFYNIINNAHLSHISRSIVIFWLAKVIYISESEFSLVVCFTASVLIIGKSYVFRLLLCYTQFLLNINEKKDNCRKYMVWANSFWTYVCNYFSKWLNYISNITSKLYLYCHSI